MYNVSNIKVYIPILDYWLTLFNLNKPNFKWYDLLEAETIAMLTEENPSLTEEQAKSIMQFIKTICLSLIKSESNRIDDFIWVCHTALKHHADFVRVKDRILLLLNKSLNWKWIKYDERAYTNKWLEFKQEPIFKTEGVARDENN